MPDVATRLTREQRRLAELLLKQRGIDPAQLPIPRRGDSSRAPLSSTQQRLWTSGKNAGGTSYGNVPMAFHVRGSLNIEWLARALSVVVGRHEILRTTYDVEAGSTLQRIHEATPVRVAVEDLRPLPPQDRERRFASRVAEVARHAFDLTADQPMRATAFRLDSTDWGVVMVSHHIATDGWGARLLLDELSAGYRAFAEEREPVLPPLAVQYGDYAEWELERLESGDLESQRQYWLQQLAGAPRQLALPFEFPAADSVATESVKIALSRELSEELRKLSRARGVTPYVSLLAGLNILFQRCTHQDDIVVGTILSRRTRSETEPLIGNFGNNLLLRTSLAGDPSVTDVIDRTSRTMRDALAHSDVPLESVAQAAPIPAFHTMFILRDGSYEERLALPDASVEPVRAASGAATLDLIVDLTDGSRGIEGYMEYRTARLTSETMRRLAEGFHDVVDRMVRDTQAHLSSFPRMEVGPTAGAVRQARSASEKPATAMERALARLWCEWLEIDTVYRDDKFFDLGGDSLRAVYVLERVERELGHRFRPEDMSRSTLAQLAARIEGSDARAAVVEEPGEGSAKLAVEGLVVKRVNPLDFENEIKNLFSRAELPHLIEFFDRAYPDAVDEGVTSWVARDETGRLVGHIAMFPHRFTCNGSEYIGGLGANLVMDRRHRNFTKAMALVQAMVEDVEGQGSVDFLFGDPNENGRAIMSSVRGCTDVGMLTRFVLPVAQRGVLAPAVAAYLKLKLRGPGRDELNVERRSAASFDVREVEAPPGESPALRPIRSPQLYRRRLDGYPADGDVWYLFTRASQRTAALLVRRFRSTTVAEVWCAWRQPGVSLAALLHPIVADLREAGITRLQACSLQASPLGKELRAIGFRPRENAGRFLALPCSPRGRALLERRVDWEITDLDCDRGFDQ